MEGISGGLKKYWRRRVRGYQRLNGRRRKLEVGGSKRRRRWRLKIKIPKISSPNKLVLRVRDAYVRMMVGLANSMGASAVNYGGNAISVDKAPPPKEYDEKMIIHMYNSFILAKGHLVSRDNMSYQPYATIPIKHVVPSKITV